MPRIRHAKPKTSNPPPPPSPQKRYLFSYLLSERHLARQSPLLAL